MAKHRNSPRELPDDEVWGEQPQEGEDEASPRSARREAEDEESEDFVEVEVKYEMNTPSGQILPVGTHSVSQRDAEAIERNNRRIAAVRKKEEEEELNRLRGEMGEESFKNMMKARGK